MAGLVLSPPLRSPFGNALRGAFGDVGGEAPSGFVLLADDSSKILLANGTDFLIRG